MRTTIFRGAYEQIGNTLPLWVDGSVDRAWGALTIPMTWFQSLNPLLVIAMTPLLLMAWRRRAEAGRETSPAIRMAIGARVTFQVATPAGTRHIHQVVSSGGSFGDSSFQLETGLGDATAIAALDAEVMRPLADAGPALTETRDAYLDAGGAIEACARKLFVHPNTVRYRLKRIADFTGRDPTTPRDAYVLRVAATVGRLSYQATNPSTAYSAMTQVTANSSVRSGEHQAG